MKNNLPSIIIQRKRRRNCWILALIVSSVDKWLYRVKIHSCKLFNRCDINDDLDNGISYSDQRGILTAHQNIYFLLKRICKGEKVSSDCSFFLWCNVTWVALYMLLGQLFDNKNFIFCMWNEVVLFYDKNYPKLKNRNTVNW